MSNVMHVTIIVEYPYSREWGNYSCRATVRAVVTRADGRNVRNDMTIGHASGAGYDKTSAAICDAFGKNPCLQTLALWHGFDPCPKTVATWKRDYGYSYGFSGAGISTVDMLMRANGFRSNVIYDRDGDLATCDYRRSIPADFLKLF